MNRQRPEWFDPQSIRLALIDLDGTLVDSVPDITYALNLALQQIVPAPAVPVLDEQVRQWVGRGAGQLVQCVVQALQLPAEQAGPLHTAFLTGYARFPCQHSRLYPGVLEFLEQSVQHGWQRVCITNKSAAIADSVLSQLRIRHYFTDLIGGDSLPQRKPDPAALLLSMQHAGCVPAQTVMIGDSRHDIEAAQRAGVRSIAVSYGYNHGEPVAASRPDWLLDSLEQIF